MPKLPKHLTVRNVPSALTAALQEERKRKGLSLNQTVINLLSQSLGLNGSRKRSNGLAKLAGGWSQADLDEFNTAIEDFNRIDEDMWR